MLVFGIVVSGKIASLVKAAGVEIDGGGAPVAPAAGGGTAVAASAKEEKKDEPTRENDEDLRFGFILA
ncbi:hypothetical protein Bca52824_047554 [Brassica carinata]|uniref:Uncharacterized protein n=1 Tax=Brassica carinata TaxID=52824 RepID=A0A8X7RJF7_BRACI|nr:hypothetical protein Bca52824_047554 [Brassica carinata]